MGWVRFLESISLPELKICGYIYDFPASGVTICKIIKRTKTRIYFWPKCFWPLYAFAQGKSQTKPLSTVLQCSWLQIAQSQFELICFKFIIPQVSRTSMAILQQGLWGCCGMSGDAVGVLQAQAESCIWLSHPSHLLPSSSIGGDGTWGGDDPRHPGSARSPDNRCPEAVHVPGLTARGLQRTHHRSLQPGAPGA